MRSASQATSLHLVPGIFGLKGRLRRWKGDLLRHSLELRAELARARRAAGTSGWWSDITDDWPEEEFRENRQGV